MARAIWSGFLSFGLVSVPVGLYTATADQTTGFHQLHKGTLNRIRYRRVDEVTGEEVLLSDIVSGYDLGGGEYVVVSRDELREVAPGKSEQIEISDFVELERIDPVYFRQTYYLAPRGKAADRAYTLLRQAMQETSKVGIATLILRDKEHLVAVRPGDEVLILETMYFDDEIRKPREEIGNLPADTAFEGRELTVAKKLVESLTVDWSPAAPKPRRRKTSLLPVHVALTSRREAGRASRTLSSPGDKAVGEEAPDARASSGYRGLLRLRAGPGALPRHRPRAPGRLHRVHRRPGLPPGPRPARARGPVRGRGLPVRPARARPAAPARLGLTGRRPAVSGPGVSGSGGSGPAAPGASASRS